MTSAVVIFACLLVSGSCLKLKNGAYEDLVVKVADTVPLQECTKIVENLEVSVLDGTSILRAKIMGSNVRNNS